MRKSNLVLLLGLFCAGKISGAAAEDVLITQYTTAVSGAPFGIAIDQGTSRSAASTSPESFRVRGAAIPSAL
jgi:hypothetical protein